MVQKSAFRGRGKNEADFRTATLAGEPTTPDFCLPFVLADGAFRGRLVRMSAAVDEILRRQNDPAPVGELLAECLAAAVALAGGIKYDGVFTLQVQSKGAVHTLVADVTTAGHVRACAKFDAERLTKELAKGRPEHLAAHLLGEGHLAFTVDQGPDMERYQGIVELTGASLADTVHHYFRQSEQLASALMIAVRPPAAARPTWQAASMLIQRMPEMGGKPVLSDDDAEDAWRTAVILMGSATRAEMLDAALGPFALLHRLFATIGVRAAAAKPVMFGCRCSRERSERILASFPREEVRALAEDDATIRMTCEFCRTDYVFSEAEIDAVAAGATAEDANSPG
ncbi:MAG: Hsp33 family molecular chaperone HslO [Rhodospirillaceae bacterium]|nr:Hsp33 family molecular chaperone HslO [Rhodospirillaceae bacterium]